MAAQIEHIKTVTPVDGSVICERVAPTPSELDQILADAKEAGRFLFQDLTLQQRIQVADRVLAELEENAEKYAFSLTEYMGRPVRFAPKEVKTAVVRGRYMLDLVKSEKPANGSVNPLADIPGQPETGFRRYIRKVPLGVVLIVFAWNYPFLILINSIIPAFLSGNAIVMKPSPQTPIVAEIFKDLFSSAISAVVEPSSVGIAQKAVQFFHTGRPDLVERAVQSPNVGLVCFTGSVAVGLAIQRAAAAVTTHKQPRVAVRTALELGGNDAAYVDESVVNDFVTSRDPQFLSRLAAEVADAAIFNSGQSCCAIERVYVHESAVDKVVSEFQAVLADSKSWKLGDPRDPETSIGPLVSAASAKRVKDVVAEAIAQGAKDQTPVAQNDSFEQYRTSSSPATAAYAIPTLLTNVTDSMTVANDETFGPVIAVIAVSSREEAVKRINESSLGLTASIWVGTVAELELGSGAESEDERARRQSWNNEITETAERMALKIEAGTVFVNRADAPVPDLAWTGWKNSGQGHTLSCLGFEPFVKLQSVHIRERPL